MQQMLFWVALEGWNKRVLIGQHDNHKVDIHTKKNAINLRTFDTYQAFFGISLLLFKYEFWICFFITHWTIIELKKPYDPF